MRLSHLVPLTAVLTAGAAFAQKPQVVLQDSIKMNRVLSSDTDYVLKSFVGVAPGYTLTIQPGTTVWGDANTKGTLTIFRGAKIVAEGTREKPISFISTDTNSQTARGSWGGIVILGNAPINRSLTTGFEARPDWLYGGTNDADSSGVLKYVRIRYPGYDIEVDKELNGLTLCGVGNKTVISHVQVEAGDDDAFEWFGGSVNSDHLIATNQTDDAFDIDFGYTGKSQYMINIQGSYGRIKRDCAAKDSATCTLDSAALPTRQWFKFENVGDFAIEAGSHTTTIGAGAGIKQSATNPTWSNLTLIDNGVGSAAIDLKENTLGTFDRMLVINSSMTDTNVAMARFSSLGSVSGITETDTAKDLYLRRTYSWGKWGRGRTSLSLPAATPDSAAKIAQARALLTSDIKVLDAAAVPLHKDLSPAVAALKDSMVGAVTDHDWISGWTFAGTVTWQAGQSGSGLSAARYASRAPAPSFRDIRLLGTDLLIRSGHAAPVSIEVVSLDGKTLRQSAVGLVAGLNTVRSAFKGLPVGSYYVRVQSEAGSLSKKVSLLPKAGL